MSVEQKSYNNVKKNYHVHGTVSSFVNGELYSKSEYISSYQRDKIIKEFLQKSNNIKGRAILYYVISVNEKSPMFTRKALSKANT